MTSLIHRLFLGLGGLAVFWALGMLSASEFGKSAALLAPCLFGVVGAARWARVRASRVTFAMALVCGVFFVDAATKGFLRDYFGLRPNHLLVMQAVFNTNAGESQEFVMQQWRNIAEAVTVFVVALSGVVGAERWLARREAMRWQRAPRRGTHIAVVCALAAFFGMHLNPTLARENPLLYWPMRYVDYQGQQAHAQALQRDFEQRMTRRDDWQVRYIGPEKNTVVWIIGESLNRNNMSLYGYARPTTPTLDAMRGELTVFRDVLSPEPATMASLMKMLTPADLDDPQAWQTSPDVVMLAEQAGYQTFWISNQVPNDGWLGLVANRADERLFINKGAGRGENNLDGNLLPGVAAALADPAPRKFIVVHLLGAHPTYHMRYPDTFARFDGVEDAVAGQLAAAGRSRWTRHMRDQYDNAIAYNDHVVGSVLRLTQGAAPTTPASLLFSSDHAQEVGHTRDHAGQSVADASGYEIPMVLWQRCASGRAAVPDTALEQRPYQADHLEHLLQGLLGVRSRYYVASRDLLSPAFQPRERRINNTVAYADGTKPGGMTVSKAGMPTLQ